METIIAATKNAHKIEEIQAIMEDLGFTVISRDAAGVPDFEVEETGETWIAAVDITDIPFVQDNVGTANEDDGKVYFILSGNPAHPDLLRDIWDYIHAWKTEE